MRVSRVQTRSNRRAGSRLATTSRSSSGISQSRAMRPWGPTLTALVLLLETQQGGAEGAGPPLPAWSAVFQLGGIKLGAPEIEPELFQVGGALSSPTTATNS